VVGAGLVQVTARQDCEESRPTRVGQASDQASDVVGQAGAGSSRALHGKGTSCDGQLRVGHSRCQRQPAMPGRDEGNWDHRRGWPVTIRATLPAGTNPGPEPRRAPLEAPQLRSVRRLEAVLGAQLLGLGAAGGRFLGNPSRRPWHAGRRSGAGRGRGRPGRGGGCEVRDGHRRSRSRGRGGCCRHGAAGSGGAGHEAGGSALRGRGGGPPPARLAGGLTRVRARAR
jgi:hypothetical protein